MPIKGLTDKVATGRGYPLIGRIRKGGEKQNGRYGADLNYFRVEFEPQYAHLAESFRAIYGEQPTEFKWAIFVGDTPDTAFETWREEYNASGALVRRCDGENQVTWLDQSGAYQNTPIACASPACKCANRGRINLILLEFLQETGVMGTFLLGTSSKHDMLVINGQLTALYDLNKRVFGIPMTIGRRPKNITTVMSGKRAKITKNLLYLYPQPEFVQNKALPALMSIVNGDPQPVQPLLKAPEPQFMSKEQFYIELAAHSITEEDARNIVKKLNLAQQHKDDPRFFEICLDAILNYIENLPEEVVEGEIVTE